MKTPRITVVGEASRWAPADHADVSFTIARRSTDSAEALRAAGEAYTALDGVLVNHRDVVVHRITTALGVREVTRWDEGRTIHEGFEAGRTETVRFAPVAGGSQVLQAVLAGVAELFVSAAEFGLAPTNPVHHDVRADAASAARSGAEAYAAGLGLTLGGVLSLHEPGTVNLSADPFESGPVLRMATAMGAGGDERVPTLAELTDEDVEVQARIVVAFALG